MTESKSVVITGSTRGLGFGLAAAFVARGCAVTVSGRTRSAVERALNELAARYPKSRIGGAVCDVTDLAAMRELWRRAGGAVDLWINNAGVGGEQLPFVRQDTARIAASIQTNLLGTIHGTRVALEGMKRRGGQIFNVEGYGADGKTMRVGMAVYGSTKTAVRYFTRSIAKEVAGGPVRVGMLVPGVVITDMLVEQWARAPRDEWERARRFYSIIGDTVETAAPWLAQRMLENRRANVTISRFSIPKMLWRFLSPSYRGRDLFAGRELCRASS